MGLRPPENVRYNGLRGTVKKVITTGGLFEVLLENHVKFNTSVKTLRVLTLAECLEEEAKEKVAKEKLEAEKAAAAEKATLAEAVAAAEAEAAKKAQQEAAEAAAKQLRDFEAANKSDFKGRALRLLGVRKARNKRRAVNPNEKLEEVKITDLTPMGKVLRDPLEAWEKKVEKKIAEELEAAQAKNAIHMNEEALAALKVMDEIMEQKKKKRNRKPVFKTPGTMKEIFADEREEWEKIYDHNALLVKWEIAEEELNKKRNGGNSVGKSKWKEAEVYELRKDREKRERNRKKNAAADKSRIGEGFTELKSKSKRDKGGDFFDLG